jgi:hypothetical protein
MLKAKWMRLEEAQIRGSTNAAKRRFRYYGTSVSLYRPLPTLRYVLVVGVCLWIVPDVLYGLNMTEIHSKLLYC